MPVLDGSCAAARWLLRPFRESHYFSQSIHFAAEKLGPAKPYLAIFGTFTVGYYFGRAGWSFWRGTTSYLFAGPLHLGTNFAKLTTGGGWAGISR
jgi:hypothetical protein